MTRNYNRSDIYSYFDLPEYLQMEVARDFEDYREETYVISKFKGNETAIPLSMFVKVHGSNFTHGIFSDSYFSGYHITLSRDNSQAVIAYKYF